MSRKVTSATTIRAESRSYFTALGAHIASLRKAAGMTQEELARAIGVSQQTVFAYELGERRVSVLILAKLAKAFDIPVAELIGMVEPRQRRQRRSLKILRHAERIQQLTKTQQRFVIKIIDVLEESSAQAPTAADGN